MALVRLLVCLLAFCALTTAPAAAHHRPWDDGEYEEEVYEDEETDDEEPSYDGVPEVQEPVVHQPPPVWTPPVDDFVPDPQPLIPAVPVPTTKTVAGRVAYVRADGKAAIPRGAPARVRQIIAAANKIVGKPYKWGGGHARLVDRGYDCSGAVSYALIRSGLLRSPLVSGRLARTYAAGAGRWVSIYANTGHVYMEVAGLRLDTSPVGDPQRRKGVRWRPVIGKRRGFASRHPAGL